MKKIKLYALVVLMVLCAIGTTGCSVKKEHQNRIEDNYRVYYEIFVGSFYDSNGDGMGDLNGVREKLDYVKDLGAGGIWFMPIMESPSYHKYDVIDYKSVDQAYGTVEDFRALCEEAHEKNIRIIIDFVINHSSSQNKWFREATSYLMKLDSEEEPDPAVCPYVDYYHFTKESKGSGWKKVGNSPYFYECGFSDGMPDLNLSCEALWAELLDAADFWMNLGADGFRMDAAKHFETDDTAFNTAQLNRLYSHCKAKNPDFYMVSEVWDSEATIAGYYASETPSMFDFPLSDSEGLFVKTARGTLGAETLVTRQAKYEEAYSAVYADYIDAPFLSNHDQVRIANNLMNNQENLKFAAALLMASSGNPFIYYGEEIAMNSRGTGDPNKRLPMRWTADEKAAGMTNKPEGATAVEQNAAPADQQLKDKNSLLNFYKEAILFRDDNPEIARGKMSVVSEFTKDDQAMVKKTWNDSSCYVLYNSGDEAITFDFKGTEYESMVVSGWLTVNGQSVSLRNGKLTLPKKSVAAIRAAKEK